MRVLAEMLFSWARHKFVAVMLVFHLALLHVAGEADVVVRRQDQAGAFPVEPLADGVDFPLIGFLLGDEVIQPEHHQRVRVCKNSFIDRELVPCLVDALINSHWMIGRLAYELLEGEGRTMEQL